MNVAVVILCTIIAIHMYQNGVIFFNSIPIASSPTDFDMTEIKQSAL